MKVLMLAWKSLGHPAAGGAEVVTDRYLTRMAKEGHEVTLFTAQAQGQKKQEKMHGYSVIRSGGRFTVYIEAFSYLLRHRNGYDVVVDQINTMPFFTVFLPMRAKKICFIHQLAREYWFTELPKIIGAVGYVLEPLYLRLYSRTQTITVSASTAKDLRALGFKHVTTIPNGYDGPFVTRAKKKQFCFVSRLVKAKGVLDAITAFKEASLPNYKLVICGDGPLREQIKALTDTAVEYRGRVSEREKHIVYAESVALLFPSVREGFGLAAIEAAACGTPTIGYDVPGLRDTVKQNGKLVKDRSELAHTIQAYTKKRPTPTTCKTWAKQFNWKKSEEKWMEATTG